jgi:hypothetical protein
MQPSAAQEMYLYPRIKIADDLSGDTYADEHVMILLLLIHLKALTECRWRNNVTCSRASQIRSWLQIRIY